MLFFSFSIQPIPFSIDRPAAGSASASTSPGPFIQTQKSTSSMTLLGRLSCLSAISYLSCLSSMTLLSVPLLFLLYLSPVYLLNLSFLSHLSPVSLLSVIQHWLSVNASNQNSPVTSWHPVLRQLFLLHCNLLLHYITCRIFAICLVMSIVPWTRMSVLTYSAWASRSIWRGALASSSPIRSLTLPIIHSTTRPLTHSDTHSPSHYSHTHSLTHLLNH